MLICGTCREPVARFFASCPHCRAENTIVSVGEDAGNLEPEYLGDVSSTPQNKIPSGEAALDHVLGGGLTRGSCIVLAGSPGAGKSTLALQAASASSSQRSTLYIAGEEPIDRIGERAHRLGLNVAGLRVSSIVAVDGIARLIRGVSPGFVVVDSLQTLTDRALRSRAGSPTQLVQCAIRLVELSRSYDCAILIVGHVTKTNALSGPRSVEHYVDVMLTFRVADARRKGDAARILEASKNRFGVAHQPVKMLMGEKGLRLDN